MKEVPTGVKIISILNYIGAVLLFGLAILFFIAPKTQPEIIEGTATISQLSGLFISLGVIFIVVAIIVFFLALGLWKGQNWARITAIVLYFLSVLSTIFPFLIIIIGQAPRENLAFGILYLSFSLAINLLIALYLLLNKDVKAAFEGAPKRYRPSRNK